MWEWLASPIDPSRPHDLEVAVSWHGRVMVLAWGFIAPTAVLIARFFKILPGQNWPAERDSKVWWLTHWVGQSVVLGLTLFGLVLVAGSIQSDMSLHGWLGYSVIGVLLVQVLLGVFRGSKGGPSSRASDGSTRGHHYDMTRWRRTFEVLHKSIGYGLLVLSLVVMIFGLWRANAPVWMWLGLAAWWTGLILAFLGLQRRGMAVDTYQAIWGNDPEHPGNRLEHPGWGVRRPGDNLKGDDHVRHDRGNRLRGD